MSTPFEHEDVQETPAEAAIRELRELLSHDKLTPEDLVRGLSALRTISGSEAPLEGLDAAFEAVGNLEHARHQDGLRFLEKQLELRAAMQRMRPAIEINDPLPDTILRLAGKTGAVLSVGQICVLSGEGGVAKSALACDIALSIAAAGHGVFPLGTDGNEDGLSDGLAQLPGGLFHGRGGEVMMLTYEDPPSRHGWRLKRLAHEQRLDEKPDLAAAVLRSVVVVDAAQMPLFGPTEQGRWLYNARPGPLPGMDHLRAMVEQVKPVLVIIDPVLCAYVGDPNGPAPVREFQSALCNLVADVGADVGAGVLALAHSTKAARGRGKSKKGEEEQGPDIYDPGMVAGSAAWTDGVRGAMTMTWHPSMEGHRVLGVSKSNWGPSRLCNILEPVSHIGDPLGFEGMGWVPGQPGGEGKGKDERRSKYDGI